MQKLEELRSILLRNHFEEITANTFAKHKIKLVILEDVCLLVTVHADKNKPTDIELFNSDKLDYIIATHHLYI